MLEKQNLFFAEIEDWVHTQYATVELIDWEKIINDDNSHVYDNSSADYQLVAENLELESETVFPSYSPIIVTEISYYGSTM